MDGLDRCAGCDEVFPVEELDYMGGYDGYCEACVEEAEEIAADWSRLTGL